MEGQASAHHVPLTDIVMASTRKKAGEASHEGQHKNRR